MADSDAGAYRCAIVNPHGKGNANFNLKLTGSFCCIYESLILRVFKGFSIESLMQAFIYFLFTGFSAPTYIEKPQISSRDDGQIMVMEFRARSILKPTFVWQKVFLQFPYLILSYL